jgi:hypothetical protein
LIRSLTHALARSLLVGLFGLWIGLGLGLGLVPLSAAADTLIVNDRAGVESLSRNEARLFLTMRVKQWPNGIPVRVFVLPDNDPLHLRVVKSLLGLFPYQLRRAWDRQLFSGTGQAPVTLETESEVIRRVAQTPGGIGYAASPPSHPAVRPLKVR